MQYELSVKTSPPPDVLPPTRPSNSRNSALNGGNTVAVSPDMLTKPIDRAGLVGAVDPLPLGRVRLAPVPLVLPNVSAVLQLEDQEFPRWSVRVGTGFLWGEATPRVVQQPIVTEPGGRNIWSYLAPDGSPLYVDGNGAEVQKSRESTKGWWWIGLDYRIRPRWRVGLEVARGTYSRQGAPNADPRPDFFYIATDRRQRAWLTGLSAAYGHGAGRWTYHLRLSALAQIHLDTERTDRLWTTEIDYRSLHSRAAKRLVVFPIPIVSADLQYRISPHWTAGPEFVLFPYGLAGLDKPDWATTQVSFGTSVGLTYRW